MRPVFDYQACSRHAACNESNDASAGRLNHQKNKCTLRKKTKTFVKNKSQWVCFFSSLWSVFAVLPSSAKRNWSEWNIWKVSCFRTSPSCGEPISTFRPTLHFPPRFFCQEQIVFSVGLLFFSFFFYCLFFFSQPPRFDSVSSSEFERFASLGRPFIVKSTVGNKDWSCEYLMERFPSVSVNPQPYDVDLNFDRSARLLGKMFDDGFAAPIRRSTPVQVGLLFLLLDFFFLWNWLLFFNRTLWMLLLWAGLRRLSSRNPTSRHQVASLFFLFSFLLNTGYSFLSVTIENELRLPSFVENSELNKQVCLLFLVFFFFFFWFVRLLKK